MNIEPPEGIRERPENQAGDPQRPQRAPEEPIELSEPPVAEPTFLPNDEDPTLPPPRPQQERRHSDKAIKVLTEAIATMSTQATTLHSDVAVIQESAKRDRRILRFMAGVGVLLTVMLVITVVTALGNFRNGQAIRDCTTPEGECSQRTARQTAAVVLSITYRTEAERLRTEIAVAESKQDTVSVATRQARLADVQKFIVASDQAIVDARTGVETPSTPSTISIPPPTLVPPGATQLPPVGTPSPN